MGIRWGFDPEKEIKRISSLIIPPGTFLYLSNCSFTNKPKSKFLVLLCDLKSPLIFLVNTEPTDFTKKRADLMRCQVTLKAAEYDFLAYDSYLDCSTLIQCSRQEIEDQVRKDNRRVKSKMSEETYFEVKQAISVARTIPAKKKAYILSELAKQYDS